MTETRRRRHVLKALGTGAFVAAAGCIGDGEDDGLIGSDDDEADDGRADPGGDSADGDAGSGDADSGDDRELDEDLHPTEVLNEDELDRFVVDLDLGHMEGVQTVYGRDGHLELEMDGGVSVEYFVVGDDEYEVVPGECMVGPRDDNPDYEDLVLFVWLDPFRGQDPNEYSVTDVTTIDGEEVYVIEDPHESWKMYVSTETGYRVREDLSDEDLAVGSGMGSDDGVANFHSWGEPDPIEPPDMVCEER